MSSAIYNESFVLYESVFRTYQRLYKRDKVKAADYINAVMEFGIDGVIPDEEEEVWFYGLDSAIASIDSAKDRRVKNKEDGAKGGRRKKDIDIELAQQMKEQGKSYEAIAKELGVSKSTIQRRFSATVSNGVKTQNLNVNDNVNENDNENDNENLNFNDNCFFGEERRIEDFASGAELQNFKARGGKIID